MFKPVVAISALATLLMAAPARTQTYAGNAPVCLHVFGELEGERMDCIFPSFAQCQASALGRPATCLGNPYFAQASPRTSGERSKRSQYPRPHQ
ncbi:DUF3551 domain-containing protein [Bradyrhizobium sp. CB1650]|uniref:DUF3551 domain-containing protein n=1 Tax=Bradyrhizobium sp. CB1650 TaxID=3039153 RepID=UPI002434DFEF|nr:DUF3551 domain-containing protein [Bradyrhizobium sp. CB1650]WGD54585.1 DUF3551 domain-containing protein [Bradyrhizobium sp. CB1650]